MSVVDPKHQTQGDKDATKLINAKTNPLDEAARGAIKGAQKQLGSEGYKLNKQFGTTGTGSPTGKGGGTPGSKNCGGCDAGNIGCELGKLSCEFTKVAGDTLNDAGDNLPMLAIGIGAVIILFMVIK